MGCDKPVSPLIQKVLESVLAAAQGEPDPIKNYFGWPAPSKCHISAQMIFTNVVDYSMWL